MSTFLLGTIKDAHCMNCNKLWNREVLTSVLPKSFVNGKYKHHRENLLFEREKSLLPAMQEIIAQEKVLSDLRALYKEAKYKGDWKTCADIRLAIPKVSSGEKKKRVKFVRKCPVEECKGFVSSKWKCGLCKSHICKDCNEVVCDGHACDPSAVETMKLLKKDTKPCPTCGEMIFKASGCSQMWCTSCHAVFDWNTMELEKGLIHNPHYYEFQRKNGTLERHPMDRPACGAAGVPAYLYYVHTMDDSSGYIGRVHRLYYHVHDYLARVIVAADVNYENRKKFMKSEISEYKFKTRIQRMEKAREKIRDVNDVLVMFRDVLRDSLIELFQSRNKDFKTIIENLCIYVNQSLMKIKVLYDNCVMQFVDMNTMTMKYDSRVH
jgi:hypothetical protein